MLFVGGTGPVGEAAVPRVREAGHEVAVAHSGAHEPAVLADVEHLHGGRDELLGVGGAVERWRPDVLVDTFAGGATAAKGAQVGDTAARCGVGQVVAVSSIDVYRHCALAGVDDHEPATFALGPLPLTEEASRRDARPAGAGSRHDNVPMEDSLHGAPSVTVLRPGAVYGPYLHPRVLREWYLVGKVARGERVLPLPDGGTQLFHRVAVERIARSIAAAIERAPSGHWACNVADPRDFTFGGLAALVAERLDWTWEALACTWAGGDHPLNVCHPVLADTSRLRGVLGVVDPDPMAATAAQVDWLWEHRAELSRLDRALR